MSQATIRRIVQEGERLRLNLLADMRSDHPAARGSVLTELLMFYGQAFENIREVASREVVMQSGLSSLVFMEILHECIFGAAIYHAWRDSSTPLHAVVEYRRMDERWERIRQMAGTEK